MTPTMTLAMIKGVFIRYICASAIMYCVTSVAPSVADSQTINQLQVKLNANFAGCLRPIIQDYSFAQSRINATLRLEKDTTFSEGPCVCRSGLYYFLVYASDVDLPEKRAWMFKKNYYKADLAFGVLPMKPYSMPHFEKITFPARRNAKGEYISKYYVALGCP